MYLSACIEWIFAQEHPEFCDRIRAVKAMGLNAVEFHLWRNKPLELIAATLAETEVELTGFVVEPRRSLVDPAQHEEFLTAVRESIAAAQKLGSPPLVVASGFERPGVSREEQMDEVIGVLRRAAALAEDGGVTLVLEPLNTRVEHPGMFLSSTKDGLDIVEAVASPRLRLLFDVYHATVMGERIEDSLAGRAHLVRHVQIADVPGRNEPGTGTIDWPATFRTLSALGYEGAIGLEYKPTEGGQESLAHVRAATGL
jgi:hydroxypyruvate isomerase